MSESTRQRVLDAAFARIAEVGIARLALEDVATEAGVSRQTVYRHFGSRDGLVEQLVLREEQWFVDRVVEAASLHPAAGEAIAAGVTEALRAGREHPLLRRLLETEPGEILPLIILGRGPVISAVRPVVVRILRDRLQVSEEDARVMADVGSRLLISYVLEPGDESPERIGSRIAGMLLHGA